MKGSIFLFGLVLLALRAGGEQIIRCDLSPVNICGSDLVIYYSECEFLMAKSKNSDLTVLDLRDCVAFTTENVEGNSTNATDSEGPSISGGRSLRGSGTLGRESEKEGVEGTDLGGVFGTIIANNTFGAYRVESGNASSTEDSETGLNKVERYFNDNLTEMDHRLFKNITKYNAKIVNVLVEHFDISTFISSGGRYNLSRLSMSILEAVIKILRARRSKVLDRFGRNGNGEKQEVNGSNDISKSTQTKALEQSQTQDESLKTKETENNLGMSEFKGLNITFKLVNLNDTISYPSIFGLALQSLSRMRVFKDLGDLFSTKNETWTFYDSGRLLQESEFGLFLNESNGQDEVASNLTSKICEIDAPTSGSISHFHCNFDSDSGDLFSKTKSFLEAAMITLGIYLQDTMGQDSFNEYSLPNFNDYSVFSENKTGNPEITRRKLLFGKDTAKRDPRANSDFYFPNFKPFLNSTDLLEVDELFVNFEMDETVKSLAEFEETLEDGEKMVEEMNEILSGELLQDSESTSGLEKTAEGRPGKEGDEEGKLFEIPTPLRIAGENYPNNKTKLGIDDFREFPGAFDRVRGTGCMLECGKDEDLHCGSNGVTYINLCEFRNAQCENKNLVFVGYGKCSPLLIRS
ncbi:kazal-type serine protease inhibitor domain-containing protein [Cryptosporidium felis]|nr:kazal-type serine protease inhibitor domain-containing protein [Cryptosporidium felis]